MFGSPRSATIQTEHMYLAESSIIAPYYIVSSTPRIPGTIACLVEYPFKRTLGVAG